MQTPAPRARCWIDSRARSRHRAAAARRSSRTSSNSSSSTAPHPCAMRHEPPFRRRGILSPGASTLATSLEASTDVMLPWPHPVRPSTPGRALPSAGSPQPPGMYDQSHERVINGAGLGVSRDERPGGTHTTPYLLDLRIAGRRKPFSPRTRSLSLVGVYWSARCRLPCPGLGRYPHRPYTTNSVGRCVDRSR